VVAVRQGEQAQGVARVRLTTEGNGRSLSGRQDRSLPNAAGLALTVQFSVSSDDAPLGVDSASTRAGSWRAM
jgi:hypothetical protein